MRSLPTKYYTHKDQPKGFGYNRGRFLVGKGRNWFFQYKKDRSPIHKGDKVYFQHNVDNGDWIEVSKSILNEIPHS